MMSEFKSGFVSIIGRPNVGKSTLLNRLIGQKIAIISHKPQTTRNNVLGILSEENYQIIFTDTPGIHAPNTKLGEFMVKSAKGAIGNADAVLFLVEPRDSVGKTEEKIMEDLRSKNIPVILVINKIDTIKKEKLFSIISTYTQQFDFEAIIPISARCRDGIDCLKEELLKHIETGPMFYPEDMVTDQPQRQVAAELIREKLLYALDKEIPHGVAIEIFAMREKKHIVEIEANIYCEKSSHKAIIIGKGGTMLKTVGSQAREDIERMLEKKVLLKLWVKVKDDWRNNNFLIKNFGFEQEF
ncbi:MAG: GTPase Era [Ruminococcaceae bacterium]|nr:GTPase Era [Oscillospiraceae bacterium]